MSGTIELAKEQIAEKIHAYITEAFLYDREDFLLTNDLPLIDQRVIDSLGLLRLITFLEETFGITLDPEGIVLDNFETINVVADVVFSNLNESR